MHWKLEETLFGGYSSKAEDWPFDKSKQVNCYICVHFIHMSQESFSRMTGLNQLYLGYGSINPERMEKYKFEMGNYSQWHFVLRYYSDAFMGMRYLTHFSLRRNCTDNILKILTKASGYTLQVLILLESYKSIKVFKSLDVENSRDVTDNGIQYICMFRVRRHKGLKE